MSTHSIHLKFTRVCHKNWIQIAYEWRLSASSLFAQLYFCCCYNSSLSFVEMPSAIVSPISGTQSERSLSIVSMFCKLLQKVHNLLSIVCIVDNDFVEPDRRIYACLCLLMRWKSHHLSSLFDSKIQFYEIEFNLIFHLNSIVWARMLAAKVMAIESNKLNFSHFASATIEFTICLAYVCVCYSNYSNYSKLVSALTIGRLSLVLIMIAIVSSWSLDVNGTELLTHHIHLFFRRNMLPYYLL